MVLSAVMTVDTVSTNGYIGLLGFSVSSQRLLKFKYSQRYDMEMTLLHSGSVDVNSIGLRSFDCAVLLNPSQKAAKA